MGSVARHVPERTSVCYFFLIACLVKTMSSVYSVEEVILPFVRIAQSFISLTVIVVAVIPLCFERRKAVESSFRGLPPSANTHYRFERNSWQLL